MRYRRSGLSLLCLPRSASSGRRVPRNSWSAAQLKGQTFKCRTLHKAKASFKIIHDNRSNISRL